MPQAGFQLSINIEGEQVISRRLLGVAYNLESFGDPLEEINKELQHTFEVNFAGRGSIFGGWAERVPQYKGGERIDTWPLLEKSGDMAGSFDGVVTDTQLTVFNTDYKFPYHQSKAPRTTNLPRRVMIGLDQERKQFIVKTFQKYVSRLIAREY